MPATAKMANATVSGKRFGMGCDENQASTARARCESATLRELWAPENFDRMRATDSMPAEPQSSEPQAILIERNKLVARRVARVLTGAGFATKQYEEPSAIPSTDVDASALVVADAFDALAVMRWLPPRSSLRAVLYTAAESDRLIPLCLEQPRLHTVLGRPSFEAPPREGELLAAARQLPIPFGAHLAWGASGIHLRPSDSAARDSAVVEVAAFANRLGAPKRVGEMLGELTHELLMNAMYDAPVDENGRARYAHDRKAEIALPERDVPHLRAASDGVRLAVEVEDRFGRLTREHVFGGLARALK